MASFRGATILNVMNKEEIKKRIVEILNKKADERGSIVIVNDAFRICGIRLEVKPLGEFISSLIDRAFDDKEKESDNRFH